MKKPSPSQWLSIGLSILLFCPYAYSFGRKEKQVQPVYIDEGSTGIPFNVACSSTAWTAIVSTDSIRRAIVYETDETALASVCLSTTSNSGDACNTSTPGVKLSTGAILVDYSGINFNCRARTAGSPGPAGSVNVFGYWTRDAEDYGAVQFSR